MFFLLSSLYFRSSIDFNCFSFRFSYFIEIECVQNGVVLHVLYQILKSISVSVSFVSHSLFVHKSARNYRDRKNHYTEMGKMRKKIEFRIQNGYLRMVFFNKNSIRIRKCFLWLRTEIASIAHFEVCYSAITSSQVNQSNKHTIKQTKERTKHSI